jgi:hypothetical protein
VTRFALSELVNGGQLALNVDGQPAAWIVPPVTDREPNPPYGYIGSFIRHHERGFTVPASHFMRGLCHHYGEGGDYRNRVGLEVVLELAPCEHHRVEQLLDLRVSCLGFG